MSLKMNPELRGDWGDILSKSTKVKLNPNNFQCCGKYKAKWYLLTKDTSSNRLLTLSDGYYADGIGMLIFCHQNTTNKQIRIIRNDEKIASRCKSIFTRKISI